MTKVKSRLVLSNGELTVSPATKLLVLQVLTKRLTFLKVLFSSAKIYQTVFKMVATKKVVLSVQKVSILNKESVLLAQTSFTAVQPAQMLLLVQLALTKSG